MSATGADDRQEVISVNTQTFVTSFVTNLVIFAVEVGAFTVAFRHFSSIYEPRTYAVPREKRVQPLPRSPLGWLFEVWHIDSRKILEQNGMDAYMFFRYLRMMAEIFLPQWIITWILMLPVYGTGAGAKAGLYKLTLGNISTNSQTRYALPLILVYGFTFYIYWVIWREMRAFIRLRHEFLSSREHVQLPQSKTVLVTGLPPEFRHERSLRKLAEYMPGGPERIWIVRDIGTELPHLFERQVAACEKLENAETKMIQNVLKHRRKAQKKFAKLEKANAKSRHPKTAEELEAIKQDMIKSYDSEAQGSLVEQVIDPADRPRHKINKKAMIPFTGHKTDTIEWCKQELVEVSEKLKEERSHLHKRPPSSSAFIRFHSQIAAHVFRQTVCHHLPLRMAGRYTEVSSEDIIWQNLSINPFQQKVRMVISWAATIGLLIAWAFPVAFIALLSNANELCAKATWLAWLCKLPTPINGVIQGILPPVALAVLFLLLPMFLSWCAVFQGVPLKSLVELSLMKRMFLFLFIHGFIICTLSSGLIASLPQIANDPASAVTILATNLPDASSFFLSYIITTGLSGSGAAISQPITMTLHYLVLFVFASTPRKIHRANHNMVSVGWGELFPNITLFTVIGLGYSIIAPIMNGFAFMAFFLFAFAYKYLFIWVYDQPTEGETGGLFFPLAIHHTFSGLYIEIFCLLGLFFLARDADGKASALPQGGLMLVLLLFTIFFHILVFSSFGPLIDNLPLDLGLEIDEDETVYIAAQRNNKLAFVKKVGLDPLASGVKGGAGILKGGGEILKQGGGKLKSQVLGASSQVLELKQLNIVRKLGKRNSFSEDADEILALEDDSDEKRAQQDADRMNAYDAAHPHAFDPPSAYVEQEPIWVPNDILGIGEAEVAHLRSLGIEASAEGATVDHRGCVRTSRPPPGSEE